MSIPFENIPGNLRVGLFTAEFRSGGTPPVRNSRVLLVGQMTAAGVAPANRPLMVRDGQESALSGHAGSMLAAMHRKARRNAPLVEIWWLPLADFAGGTAATGTITVAGAPVSSAGVASVYIAKQRVRIGVSPADTNNSIAAALAAAINAVAELPVTATVVNAVVTLTARHKGTLGNAIMVDLGRVEEEGLFGSTLFTIAAMSGGAGDPDLTTAFDSLAIDEFDWIAMPYSANDALDDGATLMGDVSGRWSWIKQLYGHVTTVSALETVGTITARAVLRNNQHESIFFARKFRSTPWEVAGALGAKIALHKSTAPELSRPMQTIKLEGIYGPLDQADVPTKVDLQTFYFSGVSGYTVAIDGSVRIDRIVTTYKRNAWGDPDWTYLDLETMAQSMYGVRFMRAEVTSQHARKAYAKTNPGKLPQIVTNEDIELTLDHAYQKLIVTYGVFEDLEAFQRNRVVETNPDDPNRADAFMKVDHVNQLRIVACMIENNLQL